MEARSADQKIVVPLTLVTGNTWDNIEEGRINGDEFGMVTPGQIVESVHKALRGDEEYFQPTQFPRVQVRNVRKKVKA